MTTTFTLLMVDGVDAQAPPTSVLRNGGKRSYQLQTSAMKRSLQVIPAGQPVPPSQVKRQ